VVSHKLRLSAETKAIDEFTENGRVTLIKMAAGTGTENCEMQEMVESLGYWEVCARWVSRLLTGKHKIQ
jgi:hypothetical protein